LKRVQAAFAAGDLGLALRYADAAHRRAPNNPELLQILGRLQLKNGDADQGLKALEAAASKRPDPDLEAVILSALVEAGRRDDAAVRLEAALHAFAVDPGDPLAAAAASFCRANLGQTTGWVGISSGLDVWGETYRTIGGAAPNLVASFPTDFDLIRRPTALQVEAIEFRCRDRPAREAVVSVRLEGAELLGSAAQFPPRVGLDGRSRFVDDAIEGWVSLDWAPRRPPSVIIRHNGRRTQAKVRPSGSTAGRYDYRCALPSGSAADAEISAVVELAAGFDETLPDSPVLLRDPGPPPRPRPGPPQIHPGGPRPVDVIVPVYRGLEATLRCLASVRKTVGADTRLIVIDDCSPESDLSAALRAVADRGECVLIRNDRNLGFPGSVNRGFSESDDRDLVILNADAEVFPGWLGGLRRAAYREARIGTVTPLSNAASIASYPIAEAVFDRPEAQRIARIAAEVNKGIAVAVPTGVGFCMYIRRDCLSEVGGFDDVAFAKGYGEENDFCARATILGWGHVIAADVYVGHLGGRSFGRRREALLERNLRILKSRYPAYEGSVADFERADPLRAARRRISQIRLLMTRPPTVLLMTLGLTGGVERFVAERAAYWRGAGARVLILRPGAKGSAEIVVHEQPEIADLLYAESDAGELAETLGFCGIEQIEFHHFLDLPPRLVEAVLGLNIPYNVYIHDYAWLCTRVTMLTSDVRFCAEPPLEACARCGASEDARIEPAISIPALRRRSGTWLREARSVIAPSRDTQQRIERYFPGLAVEVAGWEAPTDAPPSQVAPRAVTKVAVIGAIGEHKGYNVLKSCAEDAAARALPLEFVTIGFTEYDPPLVATGKVFVTGQYQEPELAELIAREAPDLALIPSIWPETWCFALTAALRAGLPTAAFDLGAVAERLRGAVVPHLLLPLGAAPAEINDTLISFAHGPPAPLVAAEGGLDTQGRADSRRIPARAADIQPSDGDDRCASRTMDRPRTPITVSGELITLNKGIYKLFVKSGVPARVGENGELLVPAVTLTAAPGVRTDAIQIMSGPLNSGDWVCAERDVLIVKILASATAVLLTSVSAEGGRPLEIRLERIDQTGAASPPSPEPRRIKAPALNPSPATLAERQGRQRQQAAPPQGRPAVHLTVLAHIQNRGDVVFEDAFWAGAPGEGLAIEAFSITPQGGIAPHQLEYKALTAAGAETAWVAGGELCGARGAAVSLVGFAIRLTGGAEAHFECEYRGAFGSGKIVGPLTNGAPCRATVGDPLEAIQLAVRDRSALAAADAESAERAQKVGPKFSVFREGAR
jgi:GT2 family glycosyltransferase